MSKSTAVSTGAIGADTIVRPAGQRGAISYAESLGGIADVYDGIDASGVLLCSLAAGDRVTFDRSVRFTNGLFVDWNAGTVVLHII